MLSGAFHTEGELDTLIILAGTPAYNAPPRPR